MGLDFVALWMGFSRFLARKLGFLGRLKNWTFGLKVGNVTKWLLKKEENG